MNTNFRILPVPEKAFAHLLGLNDAELAKHKAVRQTVTANPGFPCRNTLRDADIGEEVILFPYLHHVVAGPYRSSGPIFILPLAPAAAPKINEVPTMLTLRPQSLRAYDAAGMMVAANAVEGSKTETALHELFRRPEVVEVHLHNAQPGCFNCCAVRA